MNIGMLWFDNNPKTGFADKVSTAAAYYANKYGREPMVCYIHPGAEINLLVGGIVIRPTKLIMPNHFWLGVDGD